MSAIARSAAVPAHVPLDLVRPYPLIFGEATTEDPFQAMIPLIHEGPEVLFSTDVYPGRQPGWVFRRAKDLQQIYQDTEHFSNKDFAPFAKLIGDTWSQVPAETDPPMHGLYRAIINPLFAQIRMRELETRVRDIARDYIRRFQGRGTCEFMGEFAFRFPIAVFLELMNLPIARVDEFLSWEKKLLHSSDLAEIADGTRSIRDYLLQVIEERRAQPGKDFISIGLAAKVEGRMLTDDELMGFCFGLFVGGMDTVSTNMGLHFRHLAENPEHQRQLRANPLQIPDALEELLRAYSAVTTFRTCIKPVQIAGVQIMPGDKVAMATTLANRDPAVFPQPNEILLDRKPRQMTFGYGPHRCVGAPLARRELTIAMEEFLSAIPEFHLKPGVTIMTYLGGMIQPATLPLIWSA
jgi:cytochrome P450